MTNESGTKFSFVLTSSGLVDDERMRNDATRPKRRGVSGSRKTLRSIPTG